MMVSDLWKKTANSPVSLIDWAIKVGVAAAIGLYLVIKMVAILTAMVESNIETNRANSIFLGDIQRATVEMAGATRATEAMTRAMIAAQKEQEKASEVVKEAATAAKDAALVAAAGSEETNVLLLKSVAVHEEQLAEMKEVRVETKKIVSAVVEEMKKMRTPPKSVLAGPEKP